MKSQKGIGDSSTLALASALHGSRWLAPRLGNFTPGEETRFLFCSRVGGRVREFSPSPGFDIRTVHSGASRYLYHAVAARMKLIAWFVLLLNTKTQCVLPGKAEQVVCRLGAEF